MELLFFALELETVGDHSNELRIRGLALGVGDGIAEILLQGLQIAAVPSHLDGVTDGALHPGCGGIEALGHFGIEDLGDGIDDVIFSTVMMMASRRY